MIFSVYIQWIINEFEKVTLYRGDHVHMASEISPGLSYRIHFSFIFLDGNPFG